MTPSRFIGIDVQLRRGCCYYVLDSRGGTVESGWVSSQSTPETVQGLAALVRRCADEARGASVVGIDAPRRPLPAPREFYWNSTRSEWRRRKETDKGLGRHCEVVLRALGIANPQWTRQREDSPAWMRLGYAIFEAMPRTAEVHEVFPSASYRVLDERGRVGVSIDFTGFARGPKDMLDACVAAATVREFALGRGCEVGGGDGLGTIVLPRPLPDARISPVMDWPEPGATV